MKSRFAFALFAALLGAALLPKTAAARSAAPDAEEFVGPFATWLNVKTEFGAVGDGVADDTAALQKAFDAIRAPESKRKVLYFPSGTYRITNTLRAIREAHYESLGISVHGEDPATTILKWDGPQNGVMLEWGAWFSKISRLTLDGSGTALTAMRHGRNFSTANEISDMTFKNAGFGIEGGYFDAAGIAEDSVLRCRFVHCSKAGVSIQNFNSLDWWIRQCLFEDCRVGVTDEFGAGNFHVYQSVFHRSTESDITITHTQFFSFRNNVSIGSKAFFVAKRAAIWKDTENWGGQITIQGNLIVDTGDATPIRIASSGTTLLFDNTIVGQPGSTAPAVQEATPVGECDMVAIGNTFTVASPLAVQGRLTAFDNKTLKSSSIKIVEPLLPPTPSNKHRTVFELADGAKAVAMQAAIDAAVASRAPHAVVHVPNGNFDIDRTLVIPAGVDIEFTGDGLGDKGTRMVWTGPGPGPGPIFRLLGPSRAILSDMTLNGNDKGGGLIVENCDQPGARVWMQGSEIASSANIGLLVNGIEHAKVQMLDFGHASNGTGVRIVGGPNQAMGVPMPGRVTIYSGNSSSNDFSYDLLGGARLLVRDTWYETTAKNRFFKLSGNSRFTLHGALTAVAAAGGVPAVELDDFGGQLSLLATDLLSINQNPARIVIGGQGNGNGRVLAMGNLLAAPDPIVQTDASVRLAKVGNRASKPDGSVQLPDSPDIDQALVRSLLTDTRQAEVPLLTPIAPGRTDARLNRLFVYNCPTAIELSAK